jgi:hypothetical protein
MNRHERRRAAALNRRRTGYLHRVLAAMRASTMPSTPGVHIASIEHDPSCSIYRGGGCDCFPDISVSGPDGVTVVDERGAGTRRARSRMLDPCPPPPSRPPPGAQAQGEIAMSNITPFPPFAAEQGRWRRLMIAAARAKIGRRRGIPASVRARATRPGLRIRLLHSWERDASLDRGPFLLMDAETEHVLWPHGLPLVGLVDAMRCYEHEVTLQRIGDTDIGLAWRNFGSGWADA